MRQISRKLIIPAVVAMAWLAFPASSPAQTSSSATVRHPRNSVSGSSLSENRPGLWITRSHATHTDRLTKALDNYGGATYKAAEETTSRQQQFALAAVDAFFDFLNDLANKLKLALIAQQALGT